MTSGEFQPQPGPYGEPGGYPPPGGQPGGVGLRFAARLIDGIIVNIVAFVLAFALGALSNHWVTGLFSGLLMFIYFVALETTQGYAGQEAVRPVRARPGRHTQTDGSSRRSAILVRGYAAATSFPTSVDCGVRRRVVVAVTINSSPTKQGKHDELAGGTQVVKG